MSISLSTGVAVSLLTSAAFAQSTTTDKPAPDDKGTQVVVQGKRAEVSDRIDRRVYDLKNDPEAATGTAADILSKLPSVAISPTGAVSLRGDNRVAVLVDGKYPANGNAVIQNLSAADIDRIEVMTNPSAEYAGDAPGGIINIITKKRHPLGLSSSLNARAGNVDSNARASAIFTQGPWSVETRLITGVSRVPVDQRSDMTGPVAYTTTGHQQNNYQGVMGTLNITYKFDERRNLSLNSEAQGSWMVVDAASRYSSDTLAYDEVSRRKVRDGYANVELLYDDNNSDNGHHLSIDSWHTDYNNISGGNYADTYLVPTGGNTDYGQRSWTKGPEDDLKIDYERRMTSGDILTSGTEWMRREVDTYTLYRNAGDIAAPYQNGSSQAFQGTRTTLDAYVTYQHAFGFWTAVPGLRVEQENVGIVSQAMSARSNAAHWLPSLHLSHDLGKGKLRLSYSRKITRPDISQYNPSLVYKGSSTAYQGDPDLKSPQTDSYEAGYDLAKGDKLAGVTAYYRSTFDMLSTYSEAIGNGVILTRDINAGKSWTGGAELTLKGPLWHGFKYMVSANLFYIDMPYYNGMADDTHGGASYTGNGTLEYDGRRGDQYQISLGVTGRQYTVQGYSLPTSHVDLNWQHPLNKKVSLVLSALNIFNGLDRVTVYDTPSLRGRTRASAGTWVRAALAWKFGGKS